MPDFMIITDITASSHASGEKPVRMNTKAAASVEAEMTESSVASSPEFISESELTFSPVCLTYLPRAILTITATPTTIRDAAEVFGGYRLDDFLY